MQNGQVMSYNQLMKNLNEVSFAVNDLLLYLDTHPNDAEALDTMRRLVEKRDKYKDIHNKYYGPLTVDCTADNCNDSWAWILQPWPWEIQKGRC